MREKAIEQRLVREVKARGGICPKWVSPGFAGGGRTDYFFAGTEVRISRSEGSWGEAKSLARVKT